MKQLTIAGLLLVGGLALSVSACRKDKTDEPEEAYQPTPYQFNVPAGFPQPKYYESNPLTVEGVRLGRMLFYDPILSSNGKSCSSCHPQDEAFARSIHVNPAGESVSIPPVINLTFNPDFEWYGQEPVMEHVPLADFGPEFFNSNMDTIRARLSGHALYPRYVYEALGISDLYAVGDEELKHQLARSIIQFIRTIVSSNSKYDRVMRHQEVFTPEESDGSNIFFTERGDCFHCHGTALLTNNLFHNNGMDTVFVGQNLGRFLYTGDSSDIGKFSAPTLRNIELTPPYMHDGRFSTLEEVVEFYNSGVHWNSLNIDPIMTKPFKEYGLQLTAQEKADLVAFLKTFTDTSILTNPDFANPF
ncbi:MAG TPA: cytochrome c peroxidase [Bacteroidia bacterium]|jgi:cytochrome c peroxidase|nr:c-type cytochrome [Bacteroidia bacterium]HPD54091.1 cytochrome c peroxidase [Bacteroidia bacterium]HRI40090.1 cytochrome c peroxidase [Bacteroidia bacterium]